MKDWVKLGMVILLLLSMIAIFISPAVDLEPTALRAANLANLLFALLALAGTVLTARFDVPISPVASTFERECALLPAPDLVDLNCTRLC
ncbi:MAG: hypothetical protein WB952_09945 [Terriglobales bacterium]